MSEVIYVSLGTWNPLVKAGVSYQNLDPCDTYLRYAANYYQRNSVPSSSQPKTCYENVISFYLKVL